MTVEVKETKAKQGDKSSFTLKILLYSLAAAALIWIAAEAYQSFVIDPNASNSNVNQNEEPGALN
ncbi:hypothetical protein [Rhizobium sp. L1K21]|uniref:hypothetical protein n=1 Tax=Rhizobium sp. L1K21 TaxID=2954933 RepID=UPI00209275FE|nr:hypothetical protein [Rhizobium sp. L1K21]MCO6186530.1 hypothetical protein [Rhizobium sp. L1K21]